jgi:hypothetical protein
MYAIGVHGFFMLYHNLVPTYQEYITMEFKAIMAVVCDGGYTEQLCQDIVARHNQLSHVVKYQRGLSKLKDSVAVYHLHAGDTVGAVAALSTTVGQTAEQAELTMLSALMPTVLAVCVTRGYKSITINRQEKLTAVVA